MHIVAKLSIPQFADAIFQRSKITGMWGGIELMEWVGETIFMVSKPNMHN